VGADNKPWGSFRAVRCDNVFVFIAAEAIFLFNRAVPIFKKFASDEIRLPYLGVNISVIS